MIARIVIDQPLPIARIKLGATRGVNPADKHLKRLAVLITEAAYCGYMSDMYVLLGVCTKPTPSPTFCHTIKKNFFLAIFFIKNYLTYI